MNRGVGGVTVRGESRPRTATGVQRPLRRPLSAPTAEILNRLRAEIEAPLSLRYVRLQVKPRSFWDDRAWVPLKMILLAALVMAAALL